MTTTLNFNLSHALDAGDLISENTKPELLEFITALDSAIEEPDFTESLILKLAESLNIETVASVHEKITALLQKLEGQES